jgi:asparagine synthase (glutamine-hydrolysing)
MGGIAGIVRDNEVSDTGDLLKQMLAQIEHHGPEEAGIVIGGTIERQKNLEAINFAEKRGSSAFGHVGLAATDGEKKGQPVHSKDGQISLLFNGALYNFRELRAALPQEDVAETDGESDVIVRLIEQQYDGDLETAVKKILPMLDGVFCLALTDSKQTVIARDKIGLRQLYFSSQGDGIIFGSEKKSLMAVSEDGIGIQRLLPGHMAVLEGKGVHQVRFWDTESIHHPGMRIKDKEEALKAYSRVLSASVRKRLAGGHQVGVVFSGGIDSLLLAYMVKDMDIPFTCYTVGVEGATDIEWAQNVAEQFHFPIQIKTITLGELQEHIPRIITIIEDHSLNQVEAAIALYFAARTAHQAGEHVIMTGQGPDEIFGGYPWYSTIVDQEGYESFEQYSWEDALLGYKETFERENKIAAAHGLDMRVPYADPEVIEVAFQISPELKIQRGNDRIQKRIHREFAVSIGIPEAIAFRKKEAAQHGANVHSALEELAKQTGITEAMLDDMGYDPDLSVVEKLGSSSRYGYRYGDHHLWKPQAQVQHYLDSCASAVGFVPSN